ncbi:mu-type opioid receptor-like [Saccoglossus kowalevskii]|uniref:Mu-type opioid receptor-like n=1 Tax=Saccoglossus kowalevskii TaxID=10224 RepID=A0ABM0MYC5_SACKO|nr:PREDICTED: mu-type opioid receptor-like [Saccoglossus kowalevskii]
MDIDLNSSIGLSSYPDANLSWANVKTLPELVCAVIISLLGIVGNSAACFVVWRMNKSNSNVRLLVINQSIVDLIASCIFTLFYVVPQIQITYNATAATVYCKLYWSEMLQYTTWIASSTNLTLIALDRYYAAIHPIRYHNNQQKINFKLVFLFEWIYAICCELYWPLTMEYKNGGCEPAEIVSRIGLLIVEVFFMVILPLTCMSYAYINIYLMFKKKERQITVTNSANDAVTVAQGSSWSKASTNIVKTFIVVTVSFALCWLPLTVYNFVHVCSGIVSYEGFIYNMCLVLACCNMCVNPLIYLFKYDRFKRELRRICECGVQDTSSNLRTTQTILEESQL